MDVPRHRVVPARVERVHAGERGPVGGKRPCGAVQVRERAGDPRADQAVLVRTCGRGEVAVAERIADDITRERRVAELGEAGALIVSQMTRKSCLRPGCRVSGVVATAILIRVMPGLTESRSIAQQVRPACSPPPAKPPCADPSSKKTGSRRSPLRCLTEESTIPHSASAFKPLARLVVDALDEAYFLAGPCNVRDVGRHRVARFEETPV